MLKSWCCVIVSVAVRWCLLLVIVVCYCPLWSVADCWYHLLCSGVSCSPLMSLAVRWCLMLPAGVSCCPLVCFAVHWCVLLSTGLWCSGVQGITSEKYVRGRVTISVMSHCPQAHLFWCLESALLPIVVILQFVCGIQCEFQHMTS